MGLEMTALIECPEKSDVPGVQFTVPMRRPRTGEIALDGIHVGKVAATRGAASSCLAIVPPGAVVRAADGQS